MTTVVKAVAALGPILQPLMPAGTKIVRGQANNVPPPNVPFITLIPILMNQYTTVRTALDGTNNTMSYLMPKRLDIQMDFYGLSGGDMANIAVTVFRSGALMDQFPEGVTTLYCSDARQFPLTTGEKQYEDRWSATLSLQYNEPVILSQESFNAVGEVIADPTDITTPLE